MLKRRGVVASVLLFSVIGAVYSLFQIGGEAGFSSPRPSLRPYPIAAEQRIGLSERSPDSLKSSAQRDESMGGVEIDDEVSWSAIRRGEVTTLRENGDHMGGESLEEAQLRRSFRFHVYNVPSKYIEGALILLEQRWATSFCNRHKTKTNYTMLDWRHAHSLFTADVFIAKYLKFHPLHTNDPSKADVFVIPTMSHVYNCAGVMHYMIEVLAWVTQYPYYKTYDQHDHWLFWWKWGMHYNSVLKFWKRVQRHTPNINLISFELLEIMGRNDNTQDFSLALKPKFLQSMNSIVMPYPDFSPPLLIVPSNSDIERKRKIFFYFTGTSTIGNIRRWIKRTCEKHPNDCVFADFAKTVTDSLRLGVPTDYPSMMKESVFCGHAAGDGLSSRRPTSAVLAGCIPVLICDLCLYAWENLIDYSKFSVFVKEDDVINGRLFDILHSISSDKIMQMRTAIQRVRQHFVYNTKGPPTKGDALDMLVKELQLRGLALRQYRRWFHSNRNLSSDLRDYPVTPFPKRRNIHEVQVLPN